MSFPFADFTFYPSAVISHSHEYDYMLRPMSIPSKSMNLGVVLGPLTNLHTIQLKPHFFTETSLTLIPNSESPLLPALIAP